MRKLAYGAGAEAQPKKHETEYALRNGARPVLVEVDREPVEVQNCFFKLVTIIKKKLNKTLFFRDGTRECIGARRIYQALKTKSSNKGA